MYINIVFISLITGWIYVKSGRSILMAVIFHYTINLTGEMFYLSPEGQIIKMIIIAVMGTVLGVYFFRMRAREQVTCPTISDKL